MNLTAQLEDLFLNNFKNSKQKPERQLRSLGGQPLPHAVHRAWAGSAGILPPDPQALSPPGTGAGKRFVCKLLWGLHTGPVSPWKTLASWPAVGLNWPAAGSKLACCGVPRRAGRRAHPAVCTHSTFSPLDLNSMCRICDKHLPNSSRMSCSAKPWGRCSFSASSPWASRQAHVASTTSHEMQDAGCLWARGGSGQACSPPRAPVPLSPLTTSRGRCRWLKFKKSRTGSFQGVTRCGLPVWPPRRPRQREPGVCLGLSPPPAQS